jgi:hypothetical protein
MPGANFASEKSKSYAMPFWSAAANNVRRRFSSVAEADDLGKFNRRDLRFTV